MNYTIENRGWDGADSSKMSPLGNCRTVWTDEVGRVFEVLQHSGFTFVEGQYQNERGEWYGIGAIKEAGLTDFEQTKRLITRIMDNKEKYNCSWELRGERLYYKGGGKWEA